MVPVAAAGESRTTTLPAMKEQIYSLIRHALTALPAVGGFFVAKGWLNAEEGAQLDAKLVQFLEVVALVVSAALARAAMWLVAKYAPSLSGVLGGPSSGGNLPAWFLMVVAMAACGAGAPLLSSCTPTQVEAFRAMPITVGIEGEHGTYTYNRETGIGVVVKVREEKARCAEVPSSKFQGPRWEELALWDPRRPWRPRGMCLGELPDVIDLRSLVHDQPEGGWPLQGAGPVISAASPLR
jgi:hypothetical protein